MIQPKPPIRIFWGENYSEKPAVVKKAINTAIKTTVQSINLYPATLYEDTITAFCKLTKAKPNQVMLGHGIEGLIHITTEALLAKNDSCGMFQPSFFVFDNNLNRFRPVKYPCHYAKKINVQDLVKKIRKTKLFFLASPNTATGNYLLDRDQIEFVLKNYSGVLVVDECYFGIGQQTVIDLINRYQNLLIYRGLTKTMGLGSLRLGFAVGNQKLIAKINYHFREIELDPINAFSLAITTATLPHFEMLAKNTRRFFTDFFTFMRHEFPLDKFIQNVTTFHFMDLSRYKIPTYQVINYLNQHGYLFSDSQLKNNSGLNFPEFLELTPPPKKYWPHFAKTLKETLK